MRVIGLGMIDFETAWSSKDDASVGSVAYLRDLLEKILVEERTLEREGRLPTEAAPPVLKVKTLKTLGTATAYAEELQDHIKVGAEQLKEAALAEQRRRVEAGITDDVADVMPIQAPALSSAALGGRQLEICWGTYYYENVEGGHGGAADNKQRAFMNVLAYDFLEQALTGSLKREAAASEKGGVE